MGPYEPSEPLYQMIEQFNNGKEFARAGGQTIADAIMVSKGITLLSQTTTFNKDIRECIRQITELKK